MARYANGGSALVVVIASHMLAAPAALSQTVDALTLAVTDWEAGRYEAVALALIPAWGSVKPDDRLAADWMIAASLCRTPHLTWRRAGRERLRGIGREYVAVRTDSLLQAELAVEQRACERPPVRLTQARARRLRQVVQRKGASLTVSGGKNWSLTCGYVPGQQDPATATEGLPTGASLRRASRSLAELTLPVSGADATAYLTSPAFSRNLVQRFPTRTIVTSEHFAFWSISGHDQSQAQRLMAALEQYHRSAVDTLGVLPLPLGVYVFTASNPWQLDEVVVEALALAEAKANHSFLLGASSDAAPALAAVMQPSTMMPGTLAHELLHVLLHRDFPNIPLWLDEGIASVVETANVAGGRIVPLPNWRGRVLLSSVSSRMDIVRQLLTPGVLEQELKSADLNVRESVRKRDELFAMGRYFTMYLWETGVLPRVYRELRARVPLRLEGTEIARNEDSANQILEFIVQALGTSEPDFDTNFNAWLRRVLSRTPSQLRC